MQRVGIRARETNSIVERLHQTLKARTKVMRGLKSMPRTKAMLEGYVVHYNYVRPHMSLNGNTPAQVTGINEPSNWKGLIERATQSMSQAKAQAQKKVRSPQR